MMVQTEKKHSQLFDAHFFGNRTFSKPLALVACLIFTPLLVHSQKPESTNSNKQNASVAVPSAPVDDSLSLIEGKVVIVYDGDTIGVEGKNFEFYSIRIHGIDAPEDGQDHNKEARKKLVELIEGKEVRVIVVKKGEFDRYMGTVYLGGTDVGLTLVKSGVAWHLKQLGYEQNSEDRRKYSAAEKKARTDKLGLWSANAPIPPWEFRGQVESKNAVKQAPLKTATASPQPSAKNVVNAQTPSEGVKDPETGRTHILGPRGGCYYVSDSGRKVYVKDKSLCEKPRQ